jgi:hypothetical protein
VLQCSGLASGEWRVISNVGVVRSLWVYMNCLMYQIESGIFVASSWSLSYIKNFSYLWSCIQPADGCIQPIHVTNLHIDKVVFGL